MMPTWTVRPKSSEELTVRDPLRSGPAGGRYVIMALPATWRNAVGFDFTDDQKLLKSL